MSPAVQEVLPLHRVCLVGLRRNEHTLQPDVYLDGLPESLVGVHVVICDPMLATGGSLDRVLEMLGERGADATTVLCLIAAQPGVDFVVSRHPHVRIVAAALDAELERRRLHHTRTRRRWGPTVWTPRSLIIAPKV